MKPRRLGIRSRLFIAFGLIVFVTVLSSAVSWFVYENLSQSFNGVTVLDIPQITRASGLAAKSGEIVTAAPILMSARSDRDRAKTWNRLRKVIERSQALVNALGPVESKARPARDKRDGDKGGGGGGEGRQRETSLRQQLDDVRSIMASLDGNARRQLLFEKRNEELTERLRWAHADFLDEVDPLISDAKFNLDLLLRRSQLNEQVDLAGKRADSIKARMGEQEVLLQIKADVNLLVGLILRMANAKDDRQLNSVRLFAATAIARIHEGLARLPKRAGNVSLRQSTKTILSYVDGQNSLFQLQRDAFDLARNTAVMLDTSAALVGKFQSSATAVAAQIKAQAIEKATIAGQLTRQAKTLLVWASIGSIAIAISVVWFYVGRSLVGRVQRLNSSMERIAEGNLAAPVPLGGDDEITDMAASLEVFRRRISQTQNELVQAGKLAALGQLAAGVAHDLNQPLAALKFQAHNAKVLLSRGKGDEAIPNLDKISQLSAKMARKIGHLKTLARKPSQSIHDVDINKIIGSALELLESRTTNEGITLTTHLPRPALIVRGGENRLEQVFLNIIANALDAMQDSTHKRLTIAAFQSGTATTIAVEDSGAGIIEGMEEQIFDPFFTTKDVGEGVGLGLSISYNIVKDFGGSISIDNTYRHGSRFVVKLVTSRGPPRGSCERGNVAL